MHLLPLLYVWTYCRIKGLGKNDGDGRLSVGKATLKAGWALRYGMTPVGFVGWTSPHGAPPSLEAQAAALLRVFAETPMTAGGTGPGTLRINTRPWSQVYVDGRLIGNTPQMNISLPAGSHRVTLVNPDFNIRQSVSVTIEAGQVTTRVLTLDRPE